MGRHFFVPSHWFDFVFYHDLVTDYIRNTSLFLHAAMPTSKRHPCCCHHGEVLRTTEQNRYAYCVENIVHSLNSGKRRVKGVCPNTKARQPLEACGNVENDWNEFRF